MLNKTNCISCKQNEMGICQLTGKEIPISYIMRRNKGLPGFCPKKKKGENKNGRKRISKK
jgi:hypothetical protein